MKSFFLIFGLLMTLCCFTGCGDRGGSVTESATESELEEYDRLLAESEATSDEE
ncbi:MAG: hypothetical protein AAGD07_25965 [Planctomycetota bacterium]